MILCCSLVSIVGWVPLGLPARLLAAVIPRQGCAEIELGTPAMYVCRSNVAFLVLLSPLLFTAVLFLFRRQVGGFLRKTLTPRFPAGWRFLTAPLVATVVFDISWSYLHGQTWNRIGIVPEIVFPVAVGIFTFLTTQYSDAARDALGPLIRRRDVVPRWARFVLALALPTLVAIGVARSVSSADVSSQVIVVLSLVIAFCLMVPAPRQASVRAAR